MNIKFKAIVKKVIIDDTGSTKLTLELPESERRQALLCASLTQQVLDVTIRPEGDNE